MANRWEVLGGRVIHAGRTQTIRLDTCRTAKGVEVSDYVVRVVPDLAMVLAIDRHQRVPLVRQYRHGIGEMSLELPAGLFEAGEEAESAGRRELLEETGFGVESLDRIGVLDANPAAQNNRVHLFLGRNAHPVQPITGDGEEDLELELAPLASLLDLIDRGEIRSAASVAAILLAWRVLA